MSTVKNNGGASTPGGAVQPGSGIAKGPGTATPAGNAALPSDLGSALADAGVSPFTVPADPSAAEPSRVERTPRMNTHSTDEVDTANRPREPKSANRGGAVEVDDRGQTRNPFERLRGLALEARAQELAEPLDLEAEVDLPPRVHGKILSIGKKLMARSDRRAPQTVDRMTEGLLLLGDDAQGAGARKSGIAKGEMQNEARRFLTKVEYGRHVKRLARIMEQMKLARIGTDPQSFVMRVMREAYAIGNEQMKDYADRMKRTNALRQEIRKEAQRTRDAILATAGKEADDLLDVPFDEMSVNTAAQQITEAFYSVEEVTERQYEASTSDSEPEKGDPWDQESELSSLDARNLKAWMGDDDDIEDNLDAIIAIVPRMSNADFREYMVPILETLQRKDDEGEALRILEALPPVQFLEALAMGLHTRFGGKEEDKMETVLNGKLDALWEQTGFDAFGAYDTASEDPAQLMEAVAEARGAGAVRLVAGGDKDLRRMGARSVGVLDAFRARSTAPPEEPGESVDGALAPAAGQRKQARTVGELKDYEKYLEDALNSVGEDGQLMNLELQNQLQRQQQQLQMMSNMSKAMHDVAMSILRNVSS
ncbi:MAG: hypothetical protein AAF654_12460 [Myxococcota bacterium]